jgi:hypothetical protein
MLDAVLMYEHDRTLVLLSGVIDTDTYFLGLDHLNGRVVMDISRLEQITSMGTVRLLSYLVSLGDSALIEIRNARPRIVRQIAAIPQLVARLRMYTVRVAIHCRVCEHVGEQEVECTRTGKPGRVHCAACGNLAEIDSTSRMHLRVLRRILLRYGARRRRIQLRSLDWFTAPVSLAQEQ